MTRASVAVPRFWPLAKSKRPGGPGLNASERWSRSAALAAQPHDHVDAGDLVAFRRRRRLADDRVGIRNVEQRVLALDEEVMVLGIVGVEIGLGAVDRDLAQEAHVGELVQRVVDGRQRHRHLGLGGFLVEHLGGDVPVALAEQNPAERHALAGRTQAHIPQHRLDVMPGATGQGRAWRRRPFDRFRDIGEDYGARRCHDTTRNPARFSKPYSIVAFVTYEPQDATVSQQRYGYSKLAPFGRG